MDKFPVGRSAWRSRGTVLITVGDTEVLAVSRERMVYKPKFVTILQNILEREPGEDAIALK